MIKRISFAIVLLLACAFLALGQSDRGTLTGTVADPSGAVVPGAQITVTNTETDLKYETVTTGTGNYTVPSLPSGVYKLTVEATGFSRVEQTNVRVQVAVSTRVDITVQVGQATTSVEVTDQSSMLKTENAEQSTTVSGEKINSLPINFGIGAGAIRNPLSFAQLTPGANITGWNTVTVNGMPQYSYRVMFEGQESTNSIDPRASDELQPSVEAIQEFTLQTSNFAAEFGQVSGGLFNFTSRSGTNQYHGSAYGYGVNEALGAGIPFTDNGNGGHVRPSKKLYDCGFTFGGPVYIPKVYQGKNRTFFFFNLERYRDRESLYNGIHTMPTDALMKGDLSAMLTNRNLGTDFMGRAIMQNAIYDPATTITDSSGRLVRDVFPNNVIPVNRISPVSAKIMALLPKVQNASLVNNIALAGPFFKIQQIPSVKIDHSLSAKSRLSGYWSMEATDKLNAQDGMPEVLSVARNQTIRSQTVRLNLDQTLTPTVLLHLGAGVLYYHNPDTSPVVSTGFDSAGQLGIIGAPGTGFPRIGVLGSDTYGGMTMTLGPTNRGLYVSVKPTGVAQISWVHENHTFKAGGEWKRETFTNKSDIGLSPSLGFGSGVTAQNLYGQALPSGTAYRQQFRHFPPGSVRRRLGRQHHGSAVPEDGVGFLPPGLLEDHAKTDARLRHPLRSGAADARVVAANQYVPDGHCQSQRQRPVGRSGVRRIGSRTLQLHAGSDLSAMRSRRASALPIRSRPRRCCAAAGVLPTPALTPSITSAPATAREWDTTPSASWRRSPA